MDPETYEKRSHFRGKPRPGRRVALRYRVISPNSDADTPEVATCTRNIGAGGAFIVCQDPVPVGTRLHLSLDVPTAAQAIAVEAEVRWVLPIGMDPHSAGMGVKFLDVDINTLLELSDYFSSLTGTDPAL